MAQDTSDEQSEKKAARCACGNVEVPIGEVKKDDIVIVSTNRIGLGYLDVRVRLQFVKYGCSSS